MAVLVDSGIFYAAFDRRDAWHERVRTFFEGTNESLLVPASILPEACYLLKTRVGMEAVRLALDILATEELTFVEVTLPDVRRAREIIARYADARLDFVDASVIAVAERLGITRIATTDRRDFSLVTPTHCEHFELLP